MNREMTLQAVVTETVLSGVRNDIPCITAGARLGVLFGGSSATRIDDIFKLRCKMRRYFYDLLYEYYVFNKFINALMGLSVSFNLPYQHTL